MLLGVFLTHPCLFSAVNHRCFWQPKTAFWDQIHDTFTVHQWHRHSLLGTGRNAASTGYAGWSRAGNGQGVIQAGRKLSRRNNVAWNSSPKAIPHLDPALRARLVSALQRPDLKPTTRAKIESVLNPIKPHILPTAENGSPE